MIFVDGHSPGFFSVQFKPVQENLKRIRQIPGARFDGEKAWVCPIAFLEEFEKLFKGEFIYLTPRHDLTGDPPPPPPKMYEKIPRHPIQGLKYQLYDYQIFGANFLACIAERTGHAFLTDRVGSGKTIQAIAADHILREQGKINNVLVFCKASLKYQWLRDGVHKFTHDDGIVIDGDKRKRKQLYQDALDPRYRYVILNYELLLHDFDEIQWLVVEKDIKLIIADEAHRVTNPKGKTNNALAKLVQSNDKKKYKGVDYIFYLTATPLSSRIEQLYGLFSIRRPDYFSKYSDFSKQYLKWAYNGRRAEIIGYKNLDELREKTWKYMLRRTDKEIDMELPELVEVFRDLPFTSLQRKLDQIALQEIERLSGRLQGLYQKHAPREQIEQVEGTLKSMMYVRKAIADHPQLLLRSKSSMIQKTFMPIVQNHKEANRSPKMEELKDLVEEMVVEGGEKLIIFSELETMVQVIKEEMEAMGIRCVIYTGKIDSAKKDAAVKEFQHNPDCKIFIATDAAAEGLNLQFCPYLVNYDLPWNPDIYQQRYGRIQRGGSQYESVKVVNLRVMDGIDKTVWEAIQNKQNLFNFLVENTDQQSQAIIAAMKMVKEGD